MAAPVGQVPENGSKDETTIEITSLDSTNSIAASSTPESAAILRSAYRRIDFFLVAFALTVFVVGPGLVDHAYMEH